MPEKYNEEPCKALYKSGLAAFATDHTWIEQTPQATKNHKHLLEGSTVVASQRLLLKGCLVSRKSAEGLVTLWELSLECCGSMGTVWRRLKAIRYTKTLLSLRPLQFISWQPWSIQEIPIPLANVPNSSVVPIAFLFQTLRIFGCLMPLPFMSSQRQQHILRLCGIQFGHCVCHNATAK